MFKLITCFMYTSSDISNKIPNSLLIKYSSLSDRCEWDRLKITEILFANQIPSMEILEVAMHFVDDETGER